VAVARHGKMSLGIYCIIFLETNVENIRQLDYTIQEYGAQNIKTTRVCTVLYKYFFISIGSVYYDIMTYIMIKMNIKIQKKLQFFFTK